MVKAGDRLVRVVEGFRWGEHHEWVLVVPDVPDLTYWEFLVRVCRWRVVPAE